MQTPREHCYRCDKPRLQCLCPHVVRLHNQTPLVILQHKHESRHPLGTVRIAELGLSNTRVHIVPGWATSDRTPPAFLPPGAGLLYPGASARPLETLPASERPAALVVLDGTWHTARALFRDHAWLQTLPRYSLAPPEPSRYRIRREPSLDYVSTIEAIVYALRQLEPSLEGTEGLLQAFEHLIDVQIRESSQRGHACRPRTRRPAEVRKLPRALIENFGGLVLVYGEAARPEHDPEAAPELVHWTALRIGDGATFDRVIRRASPSEPRLLQLGLCPGDFERGVGLGELYREFQSFVGPEAWVAAWNPRTLAHFERAFGRPLTGIGLKGVYGRLRERHGDLDRILDFETPGMLPDRWALALAGVRGRARTRLANSLRVALFLRGLAQN